MPSGLNCIVVAIVAMVTLSPIGEVFDKTDKLPEDASDVLLYVICMFVFLVASVRRGAVIIIARLTSSRINAAPLVPRHFQTQIRLEKPEERGLFLAFCDLRI